MPGWGPRASQGWSWAPLLRDSPPRHCSGSCHRGDVSKLQPARPLPRGSCLGPQPRSAHHLPRPHQASRGQAGNSPQGPAVPRRRLCANSRQRHLAVLQLPSQASGRPRTRPPSLDHRHRLPPTSPVCADPLLTPLGPLEPGLAGGCRLQAMTLLQELQGSMRRSPGSQRCVSPGHAWRGPCPLATA